jgi:putative FmdB family regulatory protein
MPLYEYECTQCHRRTEKIQKFSDTELTVCPHCGGRLERTITAAAVSFKDGYGSAKPAAAGSGDSAPAAASDGGSSAGSSSDAATAAPAPSAPSTAPPAAAPAPAASSAKS